MINKQELVKLQELCDNIHFPNVDPEIYKAFSNYINELLTKYKVPYGYTINVNNGKLIKWQAKRI